MTRSQPNSFSKSRFGARPRKHSPRRADSAWAPLPFPSLEGLSPPNPLSGERSRGPPALDRKLSAPLAPRASSFTAGKAGYLPPAPLLETQPFFPAATPKSLGPGPPWGPCSLQISRSGNFPCAVFQAGRAFQNKGQREHAGCLLLLPSPTRPSAGKGKPIKSRPPLRSGANKGLENRNQQHPGGTGSRSFWSSFPFFQLYSLRRKLTCTLPGCTVSDILKSTRVAGGGVTVWGFRESD